MNNADALRAAGIRLKTERSTSRRRWIVVDETTNKTIDGPFDLLTAYDVAVRVARDIVNDTNNQEDTDG